MELAQDLSNASFGKSGVELSDSAIKRLVMYA